MTTLRSLLALAAAALPLSAQDARSAAPVLVDAAAKAVAAPSIAVVDLVRVFEQYPRYIEMKGQLQALEKTYEGRLKEMTKQIDEMRAQLGLLREDADERPERELAIERAMQDQRALGKLLRDRLELENMRMMIVAYQDFEEAIRRVAQTRGLSLVLRVHDMGDPVMDPAKLGPKSVETRIAGFERRQVWFAADAIDITQDVIKVLMVPLDGRKEGAPKVGDAPAGPQKGGG